MMTSKFVSSLTVIAAVVLVACAPQRRAPEIKSAKVVDKGSVTPTVQNEVVKSGMSDLANDKTLNTPLPIKKADEKIVEPIQIIKTDSRFKGDDSGLVVELIDKGDQKIKVAIPNSVKSEVKATAESSIKTNTVNANYKCIQNLPVLECDEMDIILDIATGTKGNEILLTKKLSIHKKIEKDLNVLNILADGKEEVYGSAKIEIIALSVSSPNSNVSVDEAKNFYKIVVVGKDLREMKENKSIDSVVNKETESFNVAVHGLPQGVVYGKTVETEMGSNSVELKGKAGSADLKLKIQRDQKFDTQNAIAISPL